jgi:hypothetical protein
MKGLMLRKVAIVSFLVIGSNNMSKIECSDVPTKADKGFLNSTLGQLKTDDEIINQAVRKFKNIIQNKDGHVERISYRVTMSQDNHVLTEVTKTYFSNYRKKPDYDSETHSAPASLQPDSVTEVIYVKRNKSLSVVHKDSRGKKRLSTKLVDLPVGFSA